MVQEDHELVIMGKSIQMYPVYRIFGQLAKIKTWHKWILQISILFLLQ